MATEKEMVNHPSHYNFGKYEVIEVLEDWKLDFCLGNALKYIARASHKDKSKTVEDLKKAIWYINREIYELQCQEEEDEVASLISGIEDGNNHYNRKEAN